MKIDEGQKKQVIILCCLIILVLGLAVYRVVGTGPEAAAPASSEQAQESNQAADDADKPAAEPEKPPVAVVAASVLGSGKGRDPFIPQVAPPCPDMRTGGVIRNPIPPLIGGGGRLPIDGMPPLGIEPPSMVGVQDLPNAAHQPEDPTRQLRLTGVIEGSVNVAIIRGPENTRYIVREGQMLDGKYQVASISRAGVRIVFNNRTFVLRLGGNDATQNGARA